MNNEEAQELLQARLNDFRRRSYAELVTILQQPQTGEIRGPSGATYQVEVQVVWDHQPGGNVRVLGSIDDGGWRAFVPLTDGFVLSPSGAFVGESR